MDPLKAPIVATLLCLCFVRALCDAASASPLPNLGRAPPLLRSKVASLGESTRLPSISHLHDEFPVIVLQVAACSLFGSFCLHKEASFLNFECTLKFQTEIAARTWLFLVLLRAD